MALSNRQLTDIVFDLQVEIGKLKMQFNEIPKKNRNFDVYMQVMYKWWDVSFPVTLLHDVQYGWKVIDERNGEVFIANNSTLFLCGEDDA